MNKLFDLSVISGFRRDADEICALLGHYAASNGNPLPTFRDNVSVPFFFLVFLTLEDVTDTLSRNVGEGYLSTLCNVLEVCRSYLIRI
jgi:hypothetical protein